MPIREIRSIDCTDDDLQHAMRRLNEAMRARGLAEGDVISVESERWDEGDKPQFTARAFYWVGQKV